jgi:hypothetical protein
MVIELSGWKFKDSDDEHEFVFPEQTSLNADHYIVVCQDTNKFSEIYPEIQNISGPFEFGLAREGDEIRLFDEADNLIVSMIYSNQQPWPEDADGTGKTIELLDPHVDLNDGSNWFSGCFGGSPGGPYVECDTVGIFNIYEASNLLSIYPNPFHVSATVIFYLESEQAVTLEVFDAFGNQVLKNRFYKFSRGLNEFILNRENWQPGVYFIKISYGNRIQVGKGMIQ